MKSRKILVIEDNSANMKLVNDLLESAGYEVLQATDGITGLATLQEKVNEVALVLLDLKLPDISGHEVIKRAKADEKTKNVPIIVVSAHAMESDIKASKDAGCVDHITKPINVVEFLDKIKNIV